MFQQIESLKDKIHVLTSELGKQTEVGEHVSVRIRSLEEEKVLVESRISKLEDDLHNSEAVRENLRRDKCTVGKFFLGGGVEETDLFYYNRFRSEVLRLLK